MDREFLICLGRITIPAPIGMDRIRYILISMLGTPAITQEEDGRW